MKKKITEKEKISQHFRKLGKQSWEARKNKILGKDKNLTKTILTGDIK